ncbi:MAG: GHMP kinase [Candidatus Eisenbacteria bacterium]|nr:GHMP kinase [Candidatus Eisenbacteria bacterium]
MRADLFVPGRVCLFGEHSDWAGGFRRSHPGIAKGHAIIAGTSQGIHATASPHAGALLLSSVTADGAHHGPVEIPMEADALLAAARGNGFFRYVAGVAYRILERAPAAAGGLRLDNDATDLPVGKGLSSSAAICVLTARAFNVLYDLGLTLAEEMEIAYEGEITTPSRCGRMDQGCAYGSRPIHMTFDGDRVEVEEIRVGAPLHLLLVDLGAGKDTAAILADLQHSYPVAVTDLDRGVQHLLGEANERTVRAAIAAIEAGDAPGLGRMMAEAQELFDRYAAPASPRELAAPALHRVLRHPPLAGVVWGGKGVGSQGDGAAQLLARGAGAREEAIEILRRDFGLHSLRLTIEPGSGSRASGIARVTDQDYA